MSIHCSNCSSMLHASYQFCPYCGYEAPRKTIVGKLAEETIETPIFCPQCKKENLPLALYCSDCGESIYEKPTTSTYFCPQCGEKITASTRHCFSCKQNINNWFTQEGKIAERLGWTGDLTLYEKMNEFYYHFIVSNKTTVGRKHDNDVVMPCEWVSGHHCKFDIAKNELVDLENSNGTFINRSDKRIKKVKLGNVDEFNIAGLFTFSVNKQENLFIFRLTAILDEKECKEVSDIKKLDKLRKNYYILISGDDRVNIRKFDGKIISEVEKVEDVYKFTVKNKYIYYSDFSKDIENKLIMKTHNQLPGNWEIKAAKHKGE